MFIFVVLVVGFSGLIAQVLLLRELLVSFYGNELTVGIILANWVFLEAMGALLLGRLIDRVNKRLFAFGILNIIFSFSFLLCLYLARTFKVILNVPAGLGLGIDSIFWASFLILLPVSFIHGGLFSFCVKIYASYSKYTQGQVVGQVYFWESIGTIVAGITFTYLFIPYFNSFCIAFVILFLNFIMLWILYLFSSNKRKILIKSSAAILLLLISFLCLLSSNWLHNKSIKLQWRNHQVLDYANSIYGNVVVTQRQEQYTFFLDGLPAITSPYPDIIFVEEFAGLPMLFHKSPREILFISGGAGGMINTLLKNRDLLKIDYLELDPLILKMVKKHPTELTEKEFADQRVNVLNLDGRFFVKNTDSTYDIVFIGLGLPSDLQTNRLFTIEFFRQVSKRLKPKGILTFTLPGSLTYLSQELKDLNACILNSLGAVYQYVRIIPGDFNIFLASDAPDIMRVESNLVIQRIKQRGLSSSLLLPDYLEYRLHSRWSDWFSDSLIDATKRTNQDFSAFALFKTLSLWNAQFSPGWQRAFMDLEHVNLSMILGILVACCIICLFLFRGQRRSRFAVSYAIVSTGFFGMLTNLLIIFSFQIVYGYLYYQIAMLIALFMAGAAFGSILLSRYLERINQPFKLFIGLETGIVLWIMVTLFAILSYPLRLLFFTLCVVSGFWVGMEFPLANKIYLKEKNQIGRSAGIIYAADLCGGWFAAMLSGIFFLPILGMTNTFMLIIVLKLTSLLFLLLVVFSRLKHLKR